MTRSHRHLWATAAVSGAIVVAACGSSGKSNGATSSSSASGFGGTHATGGAPSSSSQASTGGSGGSTGVFMSTSSGGDAAPCPTYKGDCTTQGFNCGMVSDGCGTMLDCGTCGGGQTCGASTPNVCSVPCVAKSCADQGFDCGMATDTCGNVLQCGTCSNGQTCGVSSANVCGVGSCTPKSCTDQGFNCGMQGDTCGGIVDCGSCSMGQVCGQNASTGICVTPACTPLTCTGQGFNCGMTTDGCGKAIDCGVCPSGQICGRDKSNVCGCTGLCLDQQACDGGTTTTLKGTVYAPNGKDPLPNVLVYVPNGDPTMNYGVTPFTAGVTCGSCGSEVSGTPLVSTSSAIDGTFTLANVPVGVSFPLVIQVGRWRRKVTIPAVGACGTTTLTAAQTSLPSTQAMGDPADNIPLMAFSTGSADVLECVLRKIGVADKEFSDPATQGGSGRVRFYLDDDSPGASYSAKTPKGDQLWGPPDGGGADIMQYDMVFFPCPGNSKGGDVGYAKSPSEQQTVIDYANAGGRVFATHLSYVWFYNDAPFSGTATWKPGGVPAAQNQTGTINQSFARGAALAQWLQIVAPGTPGEIALNTLRTDFTAVNAPSLAWISTGEGADGGVSDGGAILPVHYTFDTPVGAAPANQCGRVLFDDFHVENAATSPATAFPGECTTTTFTPQEHMLEFMIFDLGACVTPPTCTPKTCAELGVACGPAGDGCGNLIAGGCGDCSGNAACIGGSCVGCTPLTCAGQGFTCGSQGDGCGGVLSCGACPSGDTCTNGTCTTTACTPKSCAAQSATCGQAGDGCGNIMACGTCPAGQVCGGCGTPNQCCTPPCVPKTCADLGFTCGAATDGCGGTLTCGTCTGTTTCGGCGTPNVCCSTG